MHFLSSSQTLKKQKPLQIRSENAFFEFQPNAKKTKTTADPQRKCILAKFKVYAMLTKHCVTSGFMHFFEFQPNAKKAKTTADPQRKCIFSKFQPNAKKQKPLQIRSENAFFRVSAKR